MATGKKVVYATRDASVHTVQGGKVVGKVLPFGEYLPLSDLPEYQQKDVLEGKIATLQVMTEKQAQVKKEAWLEARGKVLPDNSVPSVEEESDDELKVGVDTIPNLDDE